MQHTARNATLAIILVLLFIVSGIYLYSALYTRPESSGSNAGSATGAQSGFSPLNGRGATSVSGTADIRYGASAGAAQPAASSSSFSGYASLGSSAAGTAYAPVLRNQAIGNQSFFSNISNAQSVGSGQYAPSSYVQAPASTGASSPYYAPTAYAYDQFGNPKSGVSTSSQPAANTSSSGGSGASVAGTVGGSVVGSLAGAAVGAAVGDPGTGSLVGGIAGGIGGSSVTSALGGIGGGGGGGGGGFGGGGGGAGGGVNGNFGGKVTNITYCTCEASTMLDIDDVRGQTISLIYMPGVSQIYANYDVYGTGQEVLGTYTQGGSCLVYQGEECNTQGNPTGTISKIGTSMY